MHITGEVDLQFIDAYDVRYKGCSIELILEELLEKLGLELGADSAGLALVERKDDGQSE